MNIINFDGLNSKEIHELYHAIHLWYGVVFFLAHFFVGTLVWIFI